jgi:hypothetical protein
MYRHLPRLTRSFNDAAPTVLVMTISGGCNGLPILAPLAKRRRDQVAHVVRKGDVSVAGLIRNRCSD